MGTGILYIILSIVASTLIVLLFKAFEKRNVNIFQTIVVNYLVCVLTGWVATGGSPFLTPFWNEAWFPLGLVMGVLFIVGFNIVASSIQLFGITIGSVVQKMSLLLSVSFSIVYFNETLNLPKGMGLLLALVAIVLANYPSKKQDNMDTNSKVGNYKKYGYILALSFLIGATIEVIMKFASDMSSESEDGSFVIFSFGMGFVFGLCYWLLQGAKGKEKIERKSLIAGLVLGIPNFFSLYFLMLALGQEGYEASVVFPITNMGIIGISTISAILIYKEKLSLINGLGVGLAMVAILLINL